MLALALGPACSGAAFDEASFDAPFEAAPSPGEERFGPSLRPLGEVVVRVDPRAGTLAFELLPAAGAEPIRSVARALTEISIEQDGLAGTGAAGTVEFVTRWVSTDPTICGDSSRFCAEVVARAFFDRALYDVYFEITSMTATGHEAYNADPAEYGLSNTLGLWRYGTLWPAGTGSNSVARVWGLNNPSDASFTLTARVVGLECTSGQVGCGGVCVDPLSDASNCGGCGTACGAGQTCTSGACAPAATTCLVGTTLCGVDACVDLLSDPSHCGACGTRCAPGLACSLGVCIDAGCTSAQSLCAGSCTDLEVDVLNCGACGVLCGVGQTCSWGVCGP